MKNKYKSLEKIVVKSQKELDDIPEDFEGQIYIEFGTFWNKAIVNKSYKGKVVARGQSSVVAREQSSVEAWEQSSVVARGQSSVVARGQSSVVAREQSSVVARGQSSVEARGQSSVVARGQSSVVAWGQSSVVAWGQSSVVAREQSSVEAREQSSVEAWEQSSVEAREQSSVVAWGQSSVEAWEQSSVEAREQSSVVAREQSSVEAREQSSVEAWEQSSVEAREQSSVEAREQSSVVAWGQSSVVARGQSSVEGNGNSQVLETNSFNGKIKIFGNARKVFLPKTIEEFMNYYGIEHTKTKAKFFKAVRKDKNGVYHSDRDRDFIYEIGKIKKEKCDQDITENCSYGINICHLNWALNYGKDWNDLAIIEVETKISNIVLPKNTDGKVRTSEVKVLREIPLEECGLYGKILAKRRQANDNN